MILFRAINIFNDQFNKTFTKFFELLLDNRFIDLLKKYKKSKCFIYEDIKHIDYDFDKIGYLDDLLFKEEENCIYSLLSNREKEIYSLKFIRKFSVKQIHQITKYNQSSISNTIQRIKRKIIK